MKLRIALSMILLMTTALLICSCSCMDTTDVGSGAAKPVDQEWESKISWGSFDEKDVRNGKYPVNIYMKSIQGEEVLERMADSGCGRDTIITTGSDEEYYRLQLVYRVAEMELQYARAKELTERIGIKDEDLVFISVNAVSAKLRVYASRGEIEAFAKALEVDSIFGTNYPNGQ